MCVWLQVEGKVPQQINQLNSVFSFHWYMSTSPGDADSSKTATSASESRTEKRNWRLWFASDSSLDHTKAMHSSGVFPSCIRRCPIGYMLSCFTKIIYFWGNVGPRKERACFWDRHFVYWATGRWNQGDWRWKVWFMVLGGRTKLSLSSFCLQKSIVNSSLVTAWRTIRGENPIPLQIRAFFTLNFLHSNNSECPEQMESLEWEGSVSV